MDTFNAFSDRFKENFLVAEFGSIHVVTGYSGNRAGDSEIVKVRRFNDKYYKHIVHMQQVGDHVSTSTSVTEDYLCVLYINYIQERLNKRREDIEQINALLSTLNDDEVVAVRGIVSGILTLTKRV